jgi:hypothetical protein
MIESMKNINVRYLWKNGSKFSSIRAIYFKIGMFCHECCEYFSVLPVTIMQGFIEAINISRLNESVSFSKGIFRSEGRMIHTGFQMRNEVV